MSGSDTQPSTTNAREALIRGYQDAQPTIDPTAWLAPTATVIGAATLAAESSVFYGAVVRADMDRVELGSSSNLQDNVVVHTDTGFPTLIGNGVSVGHLSVVHGCSIDDDVLIGMGSTILNGASIGSQSLIAAGTVVLEGTVIPPRSLVAGVPGKVRRELTDAEVDKVTDNARHYVQLQRNHRQLG